MDSSNGRILGIFESGVSIGGNLRNRLSGRCGEKSYRAGGNVEFLLNRNRNGSVGMKG